VRVNSGRVAPSYRLKEGDKVRIPPVVSPTRPAVVPEALELDWLEDKIVYEDDELILVDKPAGMAVHGGSGVNIGCIEALRCIRPSRVPLELVHRLDRATSGCLLVAKRRGMLKYLHKLLRDGGIEKTYFALVAGRWDGGVRRFDQPLASEQGTRGSRVRVDEQGKRALSIFRPVERFEQLATFVEVDIETGRRHQIRVHAAQAGYPIAGDERYGDRSFNAEMARLGLHRMFLHAASVSFAWPDHKGRFGVCVALPPELRLCLDALRQTSR